MNFSRWIASSLVLLAMTSVVPAHALNVEQFRLVFDGNGLVNLSNSISLPQKGWSAGAGLSYSDDPLEVETAPGVIQKVVDYHVNLTLAGAYGFTNRVAAGLTLPIFPALSVTPVGLSTTRTGPVLGDTSLWGKFHLWDREEASTAMGLALLPFVTLPSGSESRFTGDESLTGGLKAAYDVNFSKNKFLTNVGLRFRGEENLPGLSVGQELLFGVGYTRPVWEKGRLDVLTEFAGSTTFNNFLSDANQTPLEWLLGLKADLARDGVSHLYWTAGGSLGLGSGYGTPDFRILSSLTYQAAPSAGRKETLAEVEGEQIVILQPIHFATARWEILPQSYPVAEAVASLLKSRSDIRRVEVAGHTDHRGSNAYNLNLSGKRANAVVAKLVELGVEPARLTSVGRGETQPVVEGSDAAALAQNRRVEFHIREVRSGRGAPHAAAPSDISPNVEDY